MNVLEAHREHSRQADQIGYSLCNVQLVEGRHETSDEIVVQRMRDWGTLEGS